MTIIINNCSQLHYGAGWATGAAHPSGSLKIIA
jgi:hypothetical protein